MPQIVNLSTLLTPFTPGGSWSVILSQNPGGIFINGNDATFGDCYPRGPYIFRYTIGTPGCQDTEDVTVNVEDSIDDTVTPNAIKITCGTAANVNMTHVVIKKCPGSPGTSFLTNIVVTGPGGYTQTLTNQTITFGNNNSFTIINPQAGTYCIDIIPQGADATIWCNWQECFVLEASPDVCPATCNGPFTLCPNPNTYDLVGLFNGGSYPPGTTITYQQVSGTPTLAISGSIVTLPTNTTTGTFQFRKRATWTSANGVTFTWDSPSCTITWATQTCTFTPTMWLYPNFTVPNQSLFTVQADEIEFGGLVNFQYSNSCNSNLFQQGPYPRTTGQTVQIRTSYVCIIHGARVNRLFIRTGSGAGSYITLNTTVTYNGSNAGSTTTPGTVLYDIQQQLDTLFNNVTGVTNNIIVDNVTQSGVVGVDGLCANCGGSTGYPYLRVRFLSRVKHQPTGTWYGISKFDINNIAEMIIITPPTAFCTANSVYLSGSNSASVIHTNGSTNTVSLTPTNPVPIGSCAVGGTLTIPTATVTTAQNDTLSDYNFIAYSTVASNRNMPGTFSPVSPTCTSCL